MSASPSKRKDPWSNIRLTVELKIPPNFINSLVRERDTKDDPPCEHRRNKDHCFADECKGTGKVNSRKHLHVTASKKTKESCHRRDVKICCIRAGSASSSPSSSSQHKARNGSVQSKEVRDERGKGSLKPGSFGKERDKNAKNDPSNFSAFARTKRFATNQGNIVSGRAVIEGSVIQTIIHNVNKISFAGDSRKTRISASGNANAKKSQVSGEMTHIVEDGSRNGRRR